MITTAIVHLDGWIKRASCMASGSLGDCSLVVPTYCRAREIVMLLDTLARLPDQPGEVVVADGSPDRATGDRIGAWASSHRLAFDLLYVRSKPGLTRQRNVGIDSSTRAFIFFLDDDCHPKPGYFRAIREAFLDDAAEHVGAVCGSLVNEMAQPIPLRWRLRFLLRIVPRGTPGTYYPMATSVPRALAALFTGTRAVDIVPGGATAYRRAVLLRHRFSHFFDGYSQGEDLEMSLRIGRECMLLWCGDAHVVHEHAPGGRPSSIQKGRMDVRNRYFIWTRYRQRVRLIDRCRFWADIAYIIAYDLASAVAHLGTSPLRHALGCARGAISCIFRPPRYDEPPACRQYELTLVEYDGSSGTVSPPAPGRVQMR